MPIIDLNALMKLNDEQVKEQIQAVYEALPHKILSIPLDDTIKSNLLKALKEQGIEPDTTNIKGATFLHFTASAGHNPLLKMLTAIGFNPHATYDGNLGIMHNAVYSGNTELVNDLINTGFTLKVNDIEGKGLFYYINDQVEMLNYLIQNGLKLNTLDPMLLYHTAARGHFKIAKLFLELGIKINLNYWNRNVASIIYDTFFKNRDINTSAGKAEALSNLAKSGVKSETKCTIGLPILHYVALVGHVELFKALILIGFSKDNINYKNFNAFFSAAYYNQAAMLKTLVEAGLKMELHLLYGIEADALKKVLSTIYKAFLCIDLNNPAQKAAAVTALTQAGIGIRAKDATGLTLLNYAAKAGNMDLFKALVAIGYDKAARNYKGYNALFDAAENGHVDMVKDLFAMELKINLNQLAKARKLGITIATIYKALLNSIDCNTHSGKEQALSILAKAGIGAGAKSNQGAGFLHLAVKTDQLEVIKDLINIGFDAKEIDNLGYGLLDYAALFCQSIETIKYLLSIGLGVGISLSSYCRDEGPLHLAAKRGDLEKVTTLIDRGFNKEVRTEGRNCLWYAARSGNRPLLELLIKEYGVNLPDGIDRALFQLIPALIYFKTDKNKEAIELYSNIKQLRILHFSYLSSFKLLPHVQERLQPVFNKDIIKIISDYLPSGDEKEYEDLKNSVLPEIELRYKLLDSLIMFCDQNPADDYARAELNKLLKSKKLGVSALENELCELLQSILNLKTAQATELTNLIHKLVECQRNIEEITGDKQKLPSDHVVVLQGTLLYEKQKNTAVKLKTLQFKNKLQSISAFQFKLFCAKTIESTIILMLGLSTLCIFSPFIGWTIAVISTMHYFYNLYLNIKEDTRQNKELISSFDPAPAENTLFDNSKSPNSLLSLQEAIKNQKQEASRGKQENIGLKDQLDVSSTFQFKFFCACGAANLSTFYLGLFVVASFNPITTAITITVSVASLLATSYGLYKNTKSSKTVNEEAISAEPVFRSVVPA